jgi:hypothetical protein
VIHACLRGDGRELGRKPQVEALSCRETKQGLANSIAREERRKRTGDVR